MRYAEYMQQIEHLKMSIQEIEQTLKDHPIKRWAYCIHDKDENDDGTPKKVHIHIMMSFNSDQTIETIAKWFNDETQFIERGKSKSSKFMYENMCSYLVHETPTSDGKYHYPDNEVVANFDFHAFMEQIRKGVEEVKEHKLKPHPIEDVLIKICNNEIARLKIDEYLSDMERIKYAKEIKQAYQIRDERIAKETDRNMNVMYFFGPAGTGKTTWAKYFAKQKGYSVFVSGSSNDPFEGYLGQECVIIDDIRGSDWKINDLLKILDNNTNSLVKSRYSNKLLNDCKLMILTSVLSIDELYWNLKEHDNEPIDQLKRRCTDVIEFTPTSMTVYVYDEKTREYENKGTMPNMTNQLLYLVEHKESLINDIKNLSEALQNEPW